MRTRRAVTIIILCAVLVFSFSLSAAPAATETIFVSGPVSSSGRATITNTIVATGLASLPGDSKLSINVPVYGDYADDGFSQTVTWQPPVASPAPASATEMRDAFNNRYIRYEWALNNYTGSEFTATVTSTFDYTVTANPLPGIFTDPFPVTTAGMEDYLRPTDAINPGDASIHSEALSATSGAATEAEAVNSIIDYVRLHTGGGNCLTRANLALAMLRSVGIPARMVTGAVTDQPYTVTYVADHYEHVTTFNWGKELHVWVEVYYPQKGTWVPYDPGMNKGFVDTRHIVCGTTIDNNVMNPATGGDLYKVSLRANQESSGSLRTDLSFTGIRDTGSYQFRSLDPSPAGYLMIGRDMANHPTVTPAPTPEPTATPAPTPVPGPSVTVTPTPDVPANITPTPVPVATATPTPLPADATVHHNTNVTEGGDPGTYNVSGSVIDAFNGTRAPGASLAFDGQPFQADAEGAFLIKATNGTHTLAANAPGYDTARMNITVAGTDVVQNIRLNSTADVKGTESRGIPGFEAVLALLGLLIIGLYRHGRA